MRLLRIGFGKGGEKNFEGTITRLQMQTYLCIRDFRQKLNKKGQPYGWPRAEYTTPHYSSYLTVAESYLQNTSCVPIDQKIYDRIAVNTLY